MAVDTGLVCGLLGWWPIILLRAHFHQGVELRGGAWRSGAEGHAGSESTWKQISPCTPKAGRSGAERRGAGRKRSVHRKIQLARIFSAGPRAVSHSNE